MTKGIQVVPTGTGPIVCLNCGAELDQSIPKVDPQPLNCSQCNREFFRFSALKHEAMADMELAPEALTRFIIWARTGLSDTEFMDLMLILEEMLCPEGMRERYGLPPE